MQDADQLHHANKELGRKIACFQKLFCQEQGPERLDRVHHSIANEVLGSNGVACELGQGVEQGIDVFRFWVFIPRQALS